jgi:RNA polymerase sigma-70 factor (ECF subfamily)
MVLTAGRSDTTQARVALERLCVTYWPPLYAYVRRRGFSPEDAQDLTQEFFARLLEQKWVRDADPARGRFRTFLLTALSRFLANEWDRVRAQKRGGGRLVLSLDTQAAEAGYQAAGSDDASPDRLYDRQWAMRLLDRALKRAKDEFEATGKASGFAVLSPYLAAERGGIPYAELAAALGTSEANARQSVHRLRRQFREFFRQEILDTVADPKEAEEEIRYLLRVLG